MSIKQKRVKMLIIILDIDPCLVTTHLFDTLSDEMYVNFRCMYSQGYLFIARTVHVGYMNESF